jgi:hypothetical protein
MRHPQNKQGAASGAPTDWARLSDHGWAGSIRAGRLPGSTLFLEWSAIARKGLCSATQSDAPSEIPSAAPAVDSGVTCTTKKQRGRYSVSTPCRFYSDLKLRSVPVETLLAAPRLLISRRPRRFSCGPCHSNSHAVERPVYETERNQEKHRRQEMRQVSACLSR